MEKDIEKEKNINLTRLHLKENIWMVKNGMGKDIVIWEILFMN